MHDTLYFTDHHVEVRDRVRDFAQEVVKLSARRYDLASEFPWDNVRQMADLGLFGIPWPEELGGSGMDYLSYIMVIHELAKVDASHAITVSAHTTLGTSPIVDFGTAEQKQRYVPLLAAGKVLGGFGLTEPGAGSDAGGTATSAEERGDHYVLNGSKIFITHAGVGEIFVVTARTDPAAKRTRGITAFIVTKDTTDLEEAKRVGVGHDPSLPKCRGVMAAKKEDKLGWRASDTRELVRQDAIVPKENVLGPVNNGFRQFLHTLDGGRIGLGALALGIAEGALEECLRYTTTRRQFGKPIASFQGVHFALADIATEIEAAKHLVYHAAWLKQHRRPFKKEAAMAKLFASELAMRATTKAVQLHGGYGYTTDYPVERMMRDAKICEIGGGDQRGRVAGARPDVVQRRILVEIGELRRAVRRAVVRHPRPADRELVEPQHVHDPHGGQSRAEQLRALRHGGAHEQAAVGPAGDGELGGRRVALGDQVLRRGDEVVEHVLLLLVHAALMPLLTVFPTAAQVGHGVHPTQLQPHHHRDGEARREADVEAAVAVEVRRIRAVERESLLVRDEHRDPRAVLARVEHLFRLVPGRIEVDGGRLEDTRRAGLEVVAEDRGGIEEGCEGVEHLVVLALAADRPDRPERGKLQV